MRISRGFLPLLAIVFFSLSALPGPGAAGDPGGIGIPIVLTQIRAGSSLEKLPGFACGMLRRDYCQGARLVRIDPDGSLHVLTEEFHSACEPGVSFDGKRILFAAKRKPEDFWNIWEMKADGTEVRQITRGVGNCRSPAYQPSLFTIFAKEPWYQIMFRGDAARAMNEFGSGPAWSLYSAKMDGSLVRRLTMNPSDDLDPFIAGDGRVILASWQRMDLRRGFRGRVALFGMNIDGADYALYTAGGGKRILHMPCVTAGGLVVFVEADRVGWDGAGQLACVTLRRPLYSHREITRGEPYLYHSPSPLGDGSLLVSRRPADGSGTHGLYRLDPASGKARLLFDDPEFHDFHARALEPRPEPDGRSSVVDERYKTCKLYCLNSYITDPPLIPHMHPGLIRGLRVIEGVPYSSGDRAIYLETNQGSGIAGPGSTVHDLVPVIPRRLLGVVPVEPDGSFHLEIPPDVPVQLQTLDENGMALRTCGWIWAKHREPRGCIGCHEDPELTPENEFVQALKKPAIRLLLPPGKRRTVDFCRDLMPIIEKKCSSCHGAGGASPELTAGGVGPFNRAYVSLLEGCPGPEADDGPVAGKYVHPGQARTSPLVWRLHGRNTSRPWDGSREWKAGMCPPPASGGQPPEAGILTAEEKLTFVEWIDLGAQWNGVQSGGSR